MQQMLKTMTSQTGGSPFGGGPAANPFGAGASSNPFGGTMPPMSPDFPFPLIPQQPAPQAPVTAAAPVDITASSPIQPFANSIATTLTSEVPNSGKTILMIGVKLFFNAALDEASSGCNYCKGYAKPYRSDHTGFTFTDVNASLVEEQQEAAARAAEQASKPQEEPARRYFSDPQVTVLDLVIVTFMARPQSNLVFVS